MAKQIIHPLGWPQPKGYAHGVVASGRVLHIAGQIGWNLRSPKPKLGKTFKDQFTQSLTNVLTVLREAGGRPEDLVRLTLYVVSKTEYQAALKPLGLIWKALVGRHYPAMTVVRVAGLLEPSAKLEIEATAILEDTKKAAPVVSRPALPKAPASR